MLAACTAACVPAPTVRNVEESFLEVRERHDALKTLRAEDGHAKSAALPEVQSEYEGARLRLASLLRRIDDGTLDAEAQRAVAAIRSAFDRELVDAAESPDADSPAPPCTYDTVALPDFETLSQRIYACYGAAAASIPFEGQTLDRLGVLAQLATTEDPDQRRRLFLALQPVWRAVNADNSARSPWRTLLHLSVRRFADQRSSIEASARLLGIDPAEVEHWLVATLEAWRDATAGRTLEPWDFWYDAGAMERKLAPHVPLESLQKLNDRFYRNLGADPATLGIRYDIQPRAGKDPVAYTDFAARPRMDRRRARGIARVSAAYTTGGPGNLGELLHETGHAVHITAIRTRPAFADWPDSDIFTEALAELAAQDLYDPAWQQHYLGVAATADESLRARFSGIVLDTAWSLFEIRMHKDPGQDPNVVWSDLCARYLRIRPHPEWSWWAMRGQLIDAPGYMLNYALGAILAADLRARIREHLGESPWKNHSWYRHVSAHLFRFGLERDSRRVIEDYLGRPIRPDALIGELRTRPGKRPSVPGAGAPRLRPLPRA